MTKVVEETLVEAKEVGNSQVKQIHVEIVGIFLKGSQVDRINSSDKYESQDCADEHTDVGGQV